MFGASMRVEINERFRRRSGGEGGGGKGGGEERPGGAEGEQSPVRRKDTGIKPAQAVVDSDDGDLGGMSHDGDDVQ